MTSLYIHIPFCRSKCLYCDFYSRPAVGPDWEALVDCLLREHEARHITSTPETLYIGGGTPSMLPARQLERLINGLGITLPDEVTIEANPEDILPDSSLPDIWQNLGITRISLGIQTLDDHLLRTIGRRHSAAQAISAIEQLQKTNLHVNTDLIFSLPGQTLESWQQTLYTILQLQPHHISLYTLMYEPGTAMTRLRDTRKITPIPDALTLEMYRLACQTTAEYGYKHYEISNYAQPGHECLHNLRYWDGHSYLGIGPAAHSYDADHKQRLWNPSDIAQWMQNWTSSNPQDIATCETLSPDQLIDELLITRMRTSRGLDTTLIEPLLRAAGLSENVIRRRLRRFQQTIDAQIAQQNLKTDGTIISLTTSGIMLADYIILQLSQALSE